MNTLQDYYWAGYLVTRNVAFFSKHEIVGLLATENITPVRVVYTEQLERLHQRATKVTEELAQAQSIISDITFDLPPSPQTAFDFFYWLDVFRRTVTEYLHNGANPEQVFNYGYDLGYVVAHGEVLCFVTELEVLLPMQLSYRKQTDHLVRNIANTRHRLELAARTLGTKPWGHILWESWKSIDVLLQEMLHLSYENVEHVVMVEQHRTLCRIMDNIEVINRKIADSFSARFP